MAPIRLLCGILFLCLGLIAPITTLAAQTDEATPIAGIPTPQGNESGVSDFIPDADDDLSGAAIDAAYFNQDTYDVPLGGPGVLATLIIKMGGITTSGSYAFPPPPMGLTFSLVETIPSGPGVTCTGTNEPGELISGTFGSENIGPAYCQVNFMITSTGQLTSTSFSASVSWGDGVNALPSVSVETLSGDVLTTLEFGQVIYTVTEGESVTLTLAIHVPASPVGDGIVDIALWGIISNISNVTDVAAVSDGEGTCDAAYITDPFAAIHTSYATTGTAFTCTVAFTLTIGDWLSDSATYPLRTLTVPPSGSVVEATARINGYLSSTQDLTLELSDTSAFPGDIVTVTATQAYSQPPGAIFPPILHVHVPPGVTLQPDTIEFDCFTEQGCTAPVVTHTPTLVVATHSSLLRPELFSVTLRFDVRINDTAPPGSTIVFDANGEILPETTSSRRTGPATASLIVLQGLTTSDLDLDVPYAGEIEGTIPATGGTPGYTFLVQDQPGLGDVDLDQTTGHFTYTANALQTGDDSFTVLVTDARTPTPRTALATVQVTIADPATLTTIPLTVGSTPGQTVGGNLGPQVTGGMPPYTFDLVGEASQGVAIINEDGSFTFEANGNATGSDSFTYSVTDSALVSGAAVTTGIVEIDYAALPPTATATLSPTMTATSMATASPTSPVTVTATTATDPGMPPARSTATPTPTPAQTPVAGGSGSGTGIMTLPNTGTGATHGGSLLLLLSGGVLFLLAAGMGFARKRDRLQALLKTKSG